MFFVFQSGAAFPAICCSLELKSVFCMHFGARIPHLSAHLAFGFWLLAFGFWLCSGFLAFGFWLCAFCFCFWLHFGPLAFDYWFLAFLAFSFWAMAFGFLAFGFGFTLAVGFWLWLHLASGFIIWMAHPAPPTCFFFNRLPLLPTMLLFFHEHHRLFRFIVSLVISIGICADVLLSWYALRGEVLRPCFCLNLIPTRYCA